MPRQAAGIGAQFAGGQPRRFVDVHGNVAQFFDGLRQARPFVIVQFAGAQAALVDAANRAHHPHGQLRRAHFHGKHRHRQAFLERHVLGDVDSERGLAH